jgi:NAD(P)-dependent dehydrogenase (short-subunit alcohol dehydrogenase family)
LGAAFVAALRANPRCAGVVEMSRRDGLQLEDEDTLKAAAAYCAKGAPFQLIIDATGVLTIDGHGPEKHLGALNAEQMARQFAVNTIGPALMLKHFVPLLDTQQRAIYAKLSARVGSIADNRLGGWYGYRAAKAALNMVLQTAAIELARRKPLAVVAAMQPGTVASPLTQPFVNAKDCISAETSVQGLLAALDALPANDKGSARAHFVDYQGQPIPW